MNLPTLFGLSLKNRAHEVALEFGDLTFTFGDLDQRSSRLARELTSRGVQAGDRLSVFLENRVELIDLFIAWTKLGVIQDSPRIRASGGPAAHRARQDPEAPSASVARITVWSSTASRCLRSVPSRAC
jgi:acyl-coenzyme A synthetase/AMP-(fatty) acid ligase